MVAEHAVFVGPIKGEVTLKGGKVVDVSPDVVLVDSIEEAQAVAEAVSERYVAEGHPQHMYTGVPFKHDKAGSKKNFAAHRKVLNGEEPE